MRWGRLIFGFALGVTGGICLGYAVWRGGATLWALGLLSLALGVVSTLCAVYRFGPARTEPLDSTSWNASAAPPLGQMLMNYGLISEADLEKALARQRKEKKRLGQILVSMGLVTYAQVAEVLEEQVSRREGRLLYGVGEKLVG
jgi:hypothetical protein